MRKKFIYVLIGFIVLTGLVGCGQNKAEENTTNTTKVVVETTEAEKTPIITAGTSQVMLDEVRYYAYTAQATYETYYLTKGKEIDWSSKMDEDVTWEQGVKCIVLDDICKREWLNSISSQYDVKLTKKDKSSAKDKASKYFESTNAKLVEKINISKQRLVEVFEKEEIADKTEKKLEKDGKSTKEMYTKWKKGNNVTTESQWNNINFEKAIFTLEDVK